MMYNTQLAHLDDCFDEDNLTLINQPRLRLLTWYGFGFVFVGKDDMFPFIL